MVRSSKQVEAYANHNYDVERILQKRKGKSEVEYLVLWLGYGIEEATWISGKKLVDYKDKIAIFEGKHRKNTSEDDVTDEDESPKVVNHGAKIKVISNEGANKSRKIAKRCTKKPKIK